MKTCTAVVLTDQGLQVMRITVHKRWSDVRGCEVDEGLSSLVERVGIADNVQFIFSGSPNLLINTGERVIEIK